MKRFRRISTAALATLAVACSARKAADKADAGGVAAPEPSTLKIHAAPTAGVPQLGIIAFEVPIYQKADKASAKIGTLRLGAIINR
ncbi:MAG: hypothetical protein EOP08_10995, partial [Proteobacteria bacterium]